MAFSIVGYNRHIGYLCGLYHLPLFNFALDVHFAKNDTKK
ncbi:hypothetical protein CWATWH0401_3834 [Crocosphaera watsonii WH 0401]|uniref:Uncharacterized protein n=3 Tax=Crocosphaera watsonii TaxID=263511 RepID=G5J1U5_CROWT|nr:hypothetical protein CWATWH0003_1476 [Crocosphaera watsonii WH 0003]CCQ58666.1 hypothetical protein CWATWH0005_551 [Crocosphaera watsonii WH 0005]CCQ64515.1 hypothetical protein CWATWH0401_3834 [Crocosphaera watsonii WH 0401]